MIFAVGLDFKMEIGGGGHGKVLLNGHKHNLYIELNQDNRLQMYGYI